MSQIFISYRREDSAGHAGRLQEALERHFGDDSVFRDVEDLPPGRSFPEALAARLDGSDVMLVVIGSRWLRAERDGVPRLSLPDDYVRMEVSRALDKGIPVVPVLIDETPMPQPGELPDALRGLAERHAVRVADAGWPDDVARLIAALETALGERSPTPVRHRRSLLGAAAIGAALLVAWTLWPQAPEPPVGVWQATVRYSWGDAHVERFRFERAGASIEGTASFLGVDRAIDEVSWADGQLRFVTHSRATAGDETREITHRYRIAREGERLKVTYVAQGGFSPESPLVYFAEAIRSSE